MTKTQARKVLRDPNSTEDDKREARTVLQLNIDGSEDAKITGTPASSDPADDTTDESKASVAGSPASQTGNDNNMDASPTPNVGGAASVDSFPNTGESLNINKPAAIDAGAAAVAAQGAIRDRGQRTRPPMDRVQAPQRRSALSGEVDSVTTVQSASDTAVPNASHATQAYYDDRGYSNTREVPAPQPIPSVHIPVSNQVAYVDETGLRIGQVERGKEAGEGDIIVIGGKEWVVAGGVVGQNGNTIPVRQNLPQAVG